MKLYFIDAPYTSSNLKRTYYKNLEFFAGDYDFSNTFIRPHTIYTYKKGSWVSKPQTGGGRYLTPTALYETLPDRSKINGHAFFTSPELAQTAKLLLLQELATDFSKTIADLQNTFNKSMPNIDKPLKNLQEKYPEYFL